METRNCQNCKISFVIAPEDFAFYEKIKVPPPTFCPECRMIRRSVFYSNRSLFRVKDSRTGGDMFSGFPPSVPFPVYEKEYWWSDAWDPLQYGRDYDFSRPFFEQFREFMLAVPRPSRQVQRIVNAEYANNAGDLKNCYLCFDCGGSEDSAYLVNASFLLNSFDITTALKGELNYDSLLVDNCFRTYFSYACEETRDVWLSRNLTGCSDCFGCANLRGKQYYIFNRPYTKETYAEELGRMNLGSYAGLMQARERAMAVWAAHPYKYMFGYRTTNVTGDWMMNAKNVRDSFNITDSEDVRYSQNLTMGVRDCYDFTVWGAKAELIYETIQTGENCRSVRFCLDCWSGVTDTEYSLDCHSSSNLFGCIGLRKKSYCIFNKQYAPEEYYALRERIIRHMSDMPFTSERGHAYRYGEYFPPEFSPFAYKESFAQDLIPLDAAGAAAAGYPWREPETRSYPVTVSAADLPDRTPEDDGILQHAIGCISCGRAYRIIRQELEFLRAAGLPLPRRCPDCRYCARVVPRNPARLHHRRCQCGGAMSQNGVYRNEAPHTHGVVSCPEEFETSYASDKPEIVYCEQCYNAEAV